MAHSSTPKPDIVRSQVADEDFIPLETTQDASTKISLEDFDVLQKPKQNRKRNLLRENSIAPERDAHKQPRTEVCSVNDQVSSVSNDHSNENNDFWIDRSATTSLIELDNNSLDDVYSEFRKNQESPSENQAMQKLDFENIEELAIKFVDYVTSFNMNSFQEERALFHEETNASDYEGSKGKTALPVEDTLAVPGSSHLHENIPLSNVCLDKETKGASLHLASEDEIIKHVKETEEEMPYQYCQCKDIIDENEILRRICLDHFEDPFFCNICKVRYSQKNSHESKHLCYFCPKEFQCITQLEDHFSDHKEDFKIDCIVCKREIKKHAIRPEGRFVYKCCQAHYCSFESNNKWQLVNHLYTHFKVKIFKCNQCKERFTIKQNLQSHSRTHPLCSVCWKTFFDLDYLMLHISEKHL